MIRVNFCYTDSGVTEFIRFIGITGVTRILSFGRNLSVERAGLREAARVLAQVLCVSGLKCEFACVRTILQSKWHAYNPTSRKNAKITLITLET